MADKQSPGDRDYGKVAVDSSNSFEGVKIPTNFEIDNNRTHRKSLTRYQHYRTLPVEQDKELT